MKKYKIKDGFKCDRQSKYDFTASTVNYLESIYPNKEITLVFKELDEDGNLVDFDSDNVSTTSKTDLVMFFNDVKYVIELKERWGKYTSDYYGEDSKKGWILETNKKNELLNKQGIPLYVNLYTNDKIRFWNLNKVDLTNTIKKITPKYTVEESGEIEKEVFELWNIDSTLIERKKGVPSNGIWLNH